MQRPTCCVAPCPPLLQHILEEARSVLGLDQIGRGHIHRIEESNRFLVHQFDFKVLALCEGAHQRIDRLRRRSHYRRRAVKHHRPTGATVRGSRAKRERQAKLLLEYTGIFISC